MQVGSAGGAAPAAPVSAAEFAARLGALGAPRRAIIAVSGGPDSMALARLAASAGLNILAVTIDHGLRGSWCAAAGVAHRILAWTGEKPATGVQAAARAARYRLLAALAEEEGFDAILTGHTADDQAETVFMRLARGSGVRGLAGMEHESRIAAGPGEPVRLLRPLLETPRARIKATLEALAQEWIDDPSNDDPAFERIRTRALLAALAEQNLLTRVALVRTAARARAAAARIDAADEDWFKAHGGRFDPAGFAVLDDWGDAPGSLVARLIRAVSGADFAPSGDEAEDALAAAGAGGAATLGGAMLKRHRGKLFLFREPATLLGRACVDPIEPLALAPGATALWDNRFILTNDGPPAARGETLVFAPLGESKNDRLASLADEVGAPAEALRASPAAFPLEGGDGAIYTARSLLEERFSARVMRFP